MERITQVFVLSALAVSMSVLNSCGISSGEVFDSSHVVLSLGVVSDVHINAGVPATSEKWKSALNQLSAMAAGEDADGLDGVLVVGDLIDFPSEKLIGEFKSVYESVFDPVKVPLVYTIGNHDVPQYRWSETMVDDAAYLRKALGGNYFLADVDKEAGEGLECRHCVFGKYHVLSISPDGTSPVVYSPEALKWLDGRLAEITSKDPSRYVIVITHPMLYDTVYGSLLGESDGIWKSSLPGYWATRELPEVLAGYPQVVAFGGHLHFPLNDPRSVWQGSFTALGCASVRYMALEAGGYEDMAGQTVMKDKDEFSQGNLLQFDRRGNMRIMRMDFYNESVIGEPLVMPRPGKAGRHLERYSFERRLALNSPPVLSSLKLSLMFAPDPVEGTKAAGISAEFPAGDDDEFVHHYLLTLSRDGVVLATKKILADFYKHPLPSQMKPSWTVPFVLDGFTPGMYSVTLTAFDSWDASSEPLAQEIIIK
ncbi:MAG: metallophosphoesterase [Bacteroidales bacterium]|nr:metallophosphoesterase [Bacteroidales bacterium]